MKKSDYTKNKILHEFYKLFRKNGYKLSSLRQLSYACDMSMGHISFYFKKKEDLVITLCDDYHNAVYAVISEFFINSEEIEKFLLYHILLSYFMTNYEYIFRFVSDVSHDSVFTMWRAKSLHQHVSKLFTQEYICMNNEDIFNACISSSSGVYSVMHAYYQNSKSIYYEKIFTMFMNILFSQIYFERIDEYIQNTIRHFSTLDIGYITGKVKMLTSKY